MALSTLLHGLVLLSIPWLVLDIVAHYSRQLSKRLGSLSVRNANSADKPLASTALRVQSTLRDAARPSLTGQRRFHRGLAISRTRFTIKLETTAFNGVPDLSLRLFGVNAARGDSTTSGSDKEFEKLQAGKTSRAKSKGTLQRFYRLGAFIGTISVPATLGLLLWATMQFISDFFQSSDDAIDGVLYRRALPEADARPSRPLQLVPLIPGLTMPWDHLFPFVFALVLVQVVHEAGHAICAAMYGIRPISMGVMLVYPALPGAFVVLPPSTIREDKEADEAREYDKAERGGTGDGASNSNLSTPMRTEIVMAGVWHNAISAAAMGIVVLIGLSTLLHRSFWTPIDGLRIRSVDAASPLSKSFARNSIISEVDDTPLSTIAEGNERMDVWTDYLAKYDAGSQRAFVQGWCIPEDTWFNATTSCCDRLDVEDDNIAVKGSSDEVCFFESPHSISRCPDPLIITQTGLERCTVECSSGICARPDAREDVLRLTVRASQAAEPKIVLFQGQGAALTAAFRLAAEDFRLSAGPGLESLYTLFALIWQYSLTLHIAMSLFNLLPLPGLDGDAFVSILVGTAASRSSDSRRAWLPNAKMLEHLQRRLHAVTVVLTIVVFGGSTLLHASRA